MTDPVPENFFTCQRDGRCLFLQFDIRRGEQHVVVGFHSGAWNAAPLSFLKYHALCLEKVIKCLLCKHIHFLLPLQVPVLYALESGKIQ